MRFIGIVAAVLVGNLLTFISLIFGYFFLISDPGQAFMRSLGYDLSPLVSAYHSARIIEWNRPDYSKSQASSEPPAVATITPDPKNSQSISHNVQAPPSQKRESNGVSRSAIGSTLKTCSFWNTQYGKDGSARSKRFRDSACLRYESLTGRNVEDVLNMTTKPRSTVTYQKQLAAVDDARQERREAEREHRHQEYCDGLREEIDHYDSLLRSGGSANYMNYWRGERRDVSMRYSRECILNQ